MEQIVKRGLMSALGQKQTCAAQNVMSALLPIATTKADSPKNHVRFTPDSGHSASRVERLLMTLALGVWAFGGHIDNLDFGCF